jgi:WD40 repeat protein
MLEEARAEKGTDWLKNKESLVKAADAPVHALAFFPDDSRFIALTGTFDRTLQVWDVKSKTRLAEQKLEGARSINQIALSPDGKTLAAGNENDIEIWDVEPWRRRQTLSGHSKEVGSLVFSPDGSLLASGAHDSVRLWNTSDWKQLHEWSSGWTADLGFSPEGKHLAAAIFGRVNRNSVFIWDALTGKEAEAPELIDKPVTCIAYSPDGRFLAVGDMQCTVYVWDAKTNKRLKTFEGHHDAVQSVIFSADSKYLFSTGEDGTVRVWPLEAGQPGPPLWGHTDWVHCAGLAAAGKVLVTGDSDGHLRFWDTAEIVERPEKYHTLGGERRVFFPHKDDRSTVVAVSPDGKMLATIGDDTDKTTLKLWDVQSLHLQKTLEDELAGGPTRFSGDGKVLGYTRRYRQAVDGKDRDLVAVVLVDIATYEMKELLKDVESASFYFLPSGKTVLTGSGKEAVLWDLATRKPAHSLTIDDGEITSVIAFPDGTRIATGDSKNLVKIFDLPQKKLLYTLKGHTKLVNLLRLSPDGRRLLSLSFDQGIEDKDVRIWDPDQGSQVGTVKLQYSKSILAPLRDGKTLAYSDATRVVLWDFESGQKTQTLRGFPGGVNTIESMSLAADVPVLVTSDSHGAVRIWDLP